MFPFNFVTRKGRVGELGIPYQGSYTCKGKNDLVTDFLNIEKATILIAMEKQQSR